MEKLFQSRIQSLRNNVVFKRVDNKLLSHNSINKTRQNRSSSNSITINSNISISSPKEKSKIVNNQMDNNINNNINNRSSSNHKVDDVCTGYEEYYKIDDEIYIEMSLSCLETSRKNKSK